MDMRCVAAPARWSWTVVILLIGSVLQAQSSSQGPAENRPLSSMVAVSLADDGGTGATSIPELVKVRVAQMVADSLPADAKFPLRNTVTDSVRTLPELQSNVVVRWLDQLTNDPNGPRFGSNCDYR